MLETINLKRKMSKDEYKRVFPALQERLRRLQYELQRAEIPTVVVFEGIDGAGKATIVGKLAQRLDPRLFRVWPAMPETDEERARHFLWRYQMRLPNDGHMAVFDRSWYGRVLYGHLMEGLSARDIDRACREIIDYERWLADDGQVIVKFWLHITKKTQRQRLKALEKDPLTAWRVSKGDWERHEAYDKWLEAAERMFENTETPHAPWFLVSAQDARQLRANVFQTLITRMEEALERRLAHPKAVSRTALAAERMQSARDKMATENHESAESEARAAGLPLEEGPDPIVAPHRRRGRKKAAKPKTTAKKKTTKKTPAKRPVAGRKSTAKRKRTAKKKRVAGGRTGNA
ncbi:MAG: polyphosphate kinase 2 family protein [Planctomycetota bacterium]|jgi:polyphosphate kinase 2 (PPK2 family)